MTSIENTLIQPQYGLGDFPLHIISKIISFLPISDINQASLTCTQWLEASLHEDVTKKYFIKFQKITFSQSDKKIIELMNGSRFYSKFILRFVDFKENYDEFWIRFGKHIHDIYFEICDINQDTFFHILQFLPNLKRLRIQYTSDSISSITLFDDKSAIEKEKIKRTLSSIDEIIFENLENLNDEIFSKFGSYTNKIKVLNLRDCSKILNASTLVKFCKQHEESLTSLLMISYNLNKEQFFSGLTQIENLKLKHLELEINDCSDKVLDNFFMQQNSLESLNVEGLNNETMTSVCKHLTNLKYLKTDNCYAVKDSVAEINGLNKIEVLQLTGVGNNSDEILLKMLKDSKPKLRELQLFHPITNDSMTKLSENCPNLELLDLRFMHPIPHKGAQMIFQNLPNLTSLEFKKHAFGIDDVEDESEFISSITNLSKLKSLELSGIVSITGLNIQEIAKLKDLRIVSIDSHFKLTSEDIKYLAMNTPTIEEISFCNSRIISDELVDFITIQWKNLKTLHLVHCGTLTDNSLYSIAKNCKNLRVLNLMRSRFSDKAVETVRQMPKIRVIYF